MRFKNCIFVFLFLLVGCQSEKNNDFWYENKEEAIDVGLLNMQAIEVERLSLDTETIVLYKLSNTDALGIGSVTTSDKGYSWYGGISPFSIDFLQLEYVTESKKSFLLTVVRSEEIDTKVKLNGTSTSSNKPISFNLKINNGYYFSNTIEKIKNVSIE